MMNKQGTLLKIRLLGIFPINQFRYEYDGKKKIRTLLLGLLMVYGFGTLAYLLYVQSRAITMSAILFGLPLEIGPAVILLAYLAMTFYSSLMQASATLFRDGKEEILYSLPLSPRQFQLSNLLFMYLKEIVACLFFFIPGLLGYYQVAPFVGWQIPLLLLFILILPVFALSVGSLGGVLVAYVSSRLPFRRLLSVVGTLAFMVAVFFVSFQSTSFFDPNQLAYWLPETPGTLLGSALVLASGPLSGNGWALLLLLALSVGIFSVFFFVLDRFHDRISEAVHAPRLKKEYRLAQAARAPWKALLQKDMHLLFSNTNFLINSISGIVLLALAVGALIYQRDMVGDLGVVLSLSMDEIFFFAAVGICFLLMSGLSSVILSAEGKELEILKSLPVASRTVILTKLLPQWGIEGGAALLATLVVGIAFRISLSSVMLALTYILLQSYVLSQIGMIVGLHLPNFHWKTLVHLIKQSGAAGFNMLFGFIQGVVHFGIYFALQLALPSFLAFVLLCGLSGIQLAIQHRWLVTRGVVRYEEILP